MNKIRNSKERSRSNLGIGMFFISVGILLVLLSFVTGSWKGLPIQSGGVGMLGGGIFFLVLDYFKNGKQ